jgi:hypothetical protein
VINDAERFISSMRRSNLGLAVMSSARTSAALWADTFRFDFHDERAQCSGKPPKAETVGCGIAKGEQSSS